MKKLLVLLGILAVAGLPAQPKVAVLDAVIPDTMDTSVIVPITEKIAEELVNAKKYSVLDRANIEQVLREREFQVSGLVQDSDIKEAGKYLGADFVVTSRVSLVDGTYFISAKMINVETGAVEAQVSDQAEGRASVLIQIASRVGKKLAAGTVEAVVEPEVADKPEAGQERPPTETDKPVRKLFIAVEAGLPFFLGEFWDATLDWTDYWTSGFGIFDHTITGVGFGVNVAYQALGPVYIGAAADYFSKSINYSGFTEEIVSFLALTASVGVVFPVADGLQVYGGGKIGLSALTLGEYWSGANWAVSWEGLNSASLSYGVEVGARLLLFNFLSLGARLELLLASVSGDSDLGFSGFFPTTEASYGNSVVRLQVGAGIALGGGSKR